MFKCSITTKIPWMNVIASLIIHLLELLSFSPWHAQLFMFRVITAPLTDTGFLVILFPAILALITVLICVSNAGLARRVAFCARKRSPNLRVAHRLTTNPFSATAFSPPISVFKLYLCKGRRCRSSLRWSSRRCSPGRTPLRNHGHSCTFRSHHESRRRRTFHFRGRVSQSRPHRLKM